MGGPAWWSTITPIFQATSHTSFHLQSGKLTSLTFIQCRKGLRLIEARDLVQGQGWLVSRGAFEVGYDSVSRFTRESGRLDGAPLDRMRCGARGLRVTNRNREH